MRSPLTMRSLMIGAALASTLFLATHPARASSYQNVFATIIDPIQNITSGPHPYTGPNLEPFVGAAGEDLSFAALDDADLYVADLRFVNLDGTSLDGARLDFALLIDATLVGTRLVGASLINANLSGADLSNAVAGVTDFRNANLTGTSFADGTLLQSDLRGANLTGANLTGTSLRFAILEGAVLNDALYDENTFFPAENFYDSPPWGIDAAGISPWDAGMIPAPEPSFGWMLLFGASAVGGLGRWSRGRCARVRVAHPQSS